MTTWARVALCTALLAMGTVQAKMSDKEIAGEAAAHASKLLAEDVDSEEGMRLFNVARVVQPDSDGVLLVGGYMKRGDAPKPLPTSIAKDRLYEEMRDRGLYLLKTQFSKNASVGNLALLYFRLADCVNNQDENVLKGICYLQSYGFDLPLEDLMQDELDLKDIYGGRNKPSKVSGAKLENKDKQIIREALKMASDKLAEDAASSEGLSLVRFANHLDPSNSKALMLLQKLQRSMTIEPERSNVTTAQMVSAILSQGKDYLKKAEEDELSAHMTLLYLRTAEKLDPDNQQVMIGLMKMEKLDQTAQLDGLLETDISSFVTYDDVDTTAGRGRSTYDENRHAAAQEKDDGAIDGKKLRIKAERRLSNDKHDSYRSGLDYKVHKIDVTAVIENYVGEEVSGLSVETIIIGEKDRSRTFYVIAKHVQDGVTIKKRGKLDCQTVSASICEFDEGEGSSQYEAWLVIIRDKDGNILNAEATSRKDGFSKNADKISKIKPVSRLRHASGNTYYDYKPPPAGTLFDKDGNLKN